MNPKKYEFLLLREIEQNNLLLTKIDKGYCYKIINNSEKENLGV